MIQKWEDYGRELLGYPCVSLKHVDKSGKVEWEDTLSGTRGEIWVSSEKDHMCKAFIAVNGKYEKIISFPFADLRKQRSALGVPYRPMDQLPYANNPNGRLWRLK